MKKFKKMIFWIIGAIVLLLATINLIGWIFTAPKYRGPVTDHFDGKKFVNPDGESAKGFADVLKWMSNRQRGEWKESGAAPLTAEDIVDRVSTDSIKITFVNHSTVLIQGAGVNILTDPVWSERTSPVQWAGPKRMRPPGMKFENLPPIDAVLISHNHYDHLDMPTVKKLAKAHSSHFVAPLGVGKLLKNSGIDKVSELDWHESATIGGVEIAAVPAKHFSGRGLFDRDATLWCGYVLKIGRWPVYFVGDTGYGDFFIETGNKYGPIKAALIPIGAYKPQWFMSPIHVSPEGAVRIHVDLKAEKSIGIHHGTFPLADDGMEDPLADLSKAKKKFQLKDDEFVALHNGQSVWIR